MQRFYLRPPLLPQATPPQLCQYSAPGCDPVLYEDSDCLDEIKSHGLERT